MIRTQLETAEYDPDDFSRMKQRELDKNLLVKFENRPVHDKVASLAQGRPIYKEVAYIDIRIPGERESAACRPATARDIERFQPHYDAFMKRVGEQKVLGTPLSEWPQVTRAQVEELAFFNVRTVEQLAAVADSNAQNFQGFNGLKARAQAWLNENKGKQELETQLQERDTQIATMQAQLAELTEKLNAMQDKPPVQKAKARGRPKKTVNTDASTTDSNSE